MAYLISQALDDNNCVIQELKVEDHPSVVKEALAYISNIMSKLA